MRFNGVELLTVHPRLSVNKEIPPGKPSRDVITSGGTRGQYVYGTAMKPDEYIVRVNIACWTRDEAWRVRGLLAAWAESSGEETAQLEPTKLPGKAYDAICKSIGAPEFVGGFATVDVVFLLPRPVMHDLYTTSKSGAGQVQMSISGTEACRPAIRQTLESSREGLAISVDGETAIELSGSFSAGDYVVIDFARGEITRNEASILERLNTVSARWRPGFTPGQHTVISSDGGKMTATWRCEWK